jgi:hypothetical protein
MFGVIGILVGSPGKLFCLPLSAKIHDGVKKMRKWLDKAYKPASHVVEIIRDASSIMSEIRSNGRRARNHGAVS